MFFTNDRVFTYSLYALAGVVWFVLWKFFDTLVRLVPTLSFAFGNQTIYLLPLVTLAISVALAEAVRRNAKAKEYGVDVVVETKKVTWPNRKELQGSTLIVIVMSLVATVIIFGLDKLFESVIKLIF